MVIHDQEHGRFRETHHSHFRDQLAISNLSS